MARTKQVTDSIIIATDPLTAYNAVSHPERIPAFSPENTRGVVESEGAPAFVGMRFSGWNRRRGAVWTTGCEVTAADQGRHFAFKVRRYGLGPMMVPVAVASWDYRFEPVEGGTRVTETWTDDRRGWPDAPTRAFDWVATGKSEGFAEFQRGNIARSLAGLKKLLES
ncbi:MAG: SRPBCC family protein [Nocardiaceae bacterium]|nr:SRPBCC family protein [Nocardiaceae bacterium]